MGKVRLREKSLLPTMTKPGPWSVSPNTQALSPDTRLGRDVRQYWGRSAGLGSDIHCPLGTQSYGRKCVSFQPIPPWDVSIPSGFPLCSPGDSGGKWGVVCLMPLLQMGKLRYTMAPVGGSPSGVAAAQETKALLQL